jgi:predicted Rossmann fold nucleotide-binding protein DprA/Smf involved in DNA uptake
MMALLLGEWGFPENKKNLLKVPLAIFYSGKVLVTIWLPKFGAHWARAKNRDGAEKIPSNPLPPLAWICQQNFHLTN